MKQKLLRLSYETESELYDLYEETHPYGGISKLELRYSASDSQWTKNLPPAIVLNDDGSQVILNVSGKQNITLDFAEIHSLHLALQRYFASRDGPKVEVFNLEEKCTT